MENLKKFNTFVNEKDDVHKEMDPYQEEKWAEEDDDEGEYVDDEMFSMDDARVENYYVETVYTARVKIKEYDLKFKLIIDDDGYPYSTFEGVDGKIEPEILEELEFFVDAHSAEIKELLSEACR